MSSPDCKPYNLSDLECKIICDQAKRRMMYRNQFLIERTDPCKHCMEAGFVFDDAVQKFLSMKSCQFDSFVPSTRNIIFGLMFTVLPMLAYGGLIWYHRSEREKAIRCGWLRYKDRINKFV